MFLLDWYWTWAALSLEHSVHSITACTLMVSSHSGYCLSWRLSEFFRLRSVECIFISSSSSNVSMFLNSSVSSLAFSCFKSIVLLMYWAELSCYGCRLA